MLKPLGALFAITILAGCATKEEKLAKAHDDAKALAEKTAREATGIGEGLKTEGRAAGAAISEGSMEIVQGLSEGFEKKSEAAGESLAKGTAKFAKKIEQGLIDGFASRPITVSARLQQEGVRVERAALHNVGARVPKVKVYTIFEKPYKGELVLFARAEDGKEVGRAKLAVDEPETGKNVLFVFDELVDLSLASTLELR